MGLEKRRILVIDEDRSSREHVKTILCQNVENQVFEHHSVDGAIEDLGLTRIDTIIADVKEPGDSGLVLAKKIKRAGLNIPVILVSKYGSKDLVIQALRAGAYDFIEKPVSEIQLYDSLKRARSELKVPTDARLKKMGFSITQIQTLSLLLNGESNKEISTHLNITEQGVKYHVRILLQRFKATNRKELAVHYYQWENSLRHLQTSFE